MTRLLLDINVILDIRLDRKPHVEAAAALWVAIEQGKAQGLVPAHGLATIHYLVRRELDAARTRRALETIMRVLGVAPVDGEAMRRALALGWPDFEDAVTAAAAERAQCDVIVTRDPNGFSGCSVPVLTPAAAVACLSQV